MAPLLVDLPHFFAWVESEYLVRTATNNHRDHQTHLAILNRLEHSRWLLQSLVYFERYLRRQAISRFFVHRSVQFSLRPNRRILLDSDLGFDRTRILRIFVVASARIIGKIHEQV